MMKNIISNYISQIYFGEIQSFNNMQLLPLFCDAEEDLSYLTLEEALKKGLLLVQEVSEGGSVPELKVKNLAEVPVLLLDGEELAGAKQNRILNTTILVKGKSEMIIPVSCTEQGRWSYKTEKFYDSDLVSPMFLRARKASSVSASLKQDRGYHSDQGAVWEDVAFLRRKVKTDSPTGAMKDTYEQKKTNLGDYLKAFQCVPFQKGIFVFVDGEAIGFDLLSRESSFKILFPKLVKSYAMEALMEEKKKVTTCRYPKEEARKFLEEIQDCKEEIYPSRGQGYDYRFEGNDKVGSALVVEQEVIHMAFFKSNKEEQTGRMSGYKRRRGFRSI
jgi:hypothetical protein